MYDTAKFETLEIELGDSVATLWLNRPCARNALNLRMCNELISACELVESDPDIRLVVIRARGLAFCAGADLKERKAMTHADVVARRVEGFTAYAALESLPMPVIAVVHGPAFGSGAEIAAACDFILATHDASFRYPEVGWGTVGATQRLPRIVGRQMAKELLFTGRIVQADEAMRLGLVNHVYLPEELEERTSELIQAIAAADPLTMRLTKKSIDQGLDTTRQGAMAVELMAIQKNLRQGDWKNALEAFGLSR